MSKMELLSAQEAGKEKMEITSEVLRRDRVFSSGRSSATKFCANVHVPGSQK